jgi:hypothetical protein
VALHTKHTGLREIDFILYAYRVSCCAPPCAMKPSSAQGISSAGVNMINQVHIFTGTSYALDRVADPPIGALWVRGMEYIGNGTGALHGGHKVHTVRITESYFDYAGVYIDDPMEISFDMCYFLGDPGEPEIHRAAPESGPTLRLL